MKEEVITYPREWEREYKQTGLVAAWRQEYPRLYRRTVKATGRDHLSSRLGTLDLFAQYALQYLLRKQGWHSVTWYKLATIEPEAKNRALIDHHWSVMFRLMGKDFAKLQRSIICAGFTTFAGEPDLFCWNKTGKWFFAEAKRHDRLGKRQRRWFKICQQTLGKRGIVRLFRLTPGTPNRSQRPPNHNALRYP